MSLIDFAYNHWINYPKMVKKILHQAIYPGVTILIAYLFTGVIIETTISQIVTNRIKKKYLSGVTVYS